MHFSSVSYALCALISGGFAAPASIAAREISLPSYLEPVYPRQAQFAVPVTANTGSLPFDKIVGFGDDFTDDGTGSYGHHLTGDGTSNMWGYATFTDGPVAITYLSQMIGKPVAYNYAFGSSLGAQTVGSVLANRLVPQTQRASHAMLNSDMLVPAARQQVYNYSHGDPSLRNNIDTTLHFFWSGNNDVIASLGWEGRFTICASDTLCTGSQDTFVSQMADAYNATLTALVMSGAHYVLVPNVYPRHLTPWTSMWISPEQGLIDNFGALIDRLNMQLSSTIDAVNAAHGSKIMYYDVNSVIKNAYSNPSAAGLVDGYTNTCVDGCKIQGPASATNWDTWMTNTVENTLPDNFLWMTEIMPSTTVHKAIAADMVNFLTSQSY